MSKNPMFAAAVAVAVLLSAGAAAAADLCEGGPRDQWLTEAQFAEKLSALGYGEFTLKVEDNCIEAMTTKDGQYVEVYMEPVTGEIVKTEND